ncbi:MAG: hypothetical protein O9342_15570 [Beijerinckiaceae bacterium]|nr:hypothetical protein [Beijerinckiaceae bacterium]
MARIKSTDGFPRVIATSQASAAATPSISTALPLFQEVMNIVR